MNDQKSWQKIVGIIVIITALGGVGYYIYIDSTSSQNTTDNEKIVDSDEGNKDTEIDQEKETPIGDIPTDIGGEEVIQIPDLNRPIVFLIELPQELKELYQGRIETLTAELILDSSAAVNWIDLGVQRKGIGDYEGARDIWEYINVVSPQNNVSFFNLGDLYHFYLKDFPAAERNLLIAKDNNEDYIPTYRALYDLYTLSYKQESTAAEDILLEGLEKNPNNLDLLVLLAGYYKNNGNTDGARTFYGEALEEAKRLENQSMVDLLEEELGSL